MVGRMKRSPLSAVVLQVLVLALALAACRTHESGPRTIAAKSSAARAGAPPATAPHRFDGIGPHHRKITTSSADAQHWFDQGLAFAYAFNHDEAIRSFTAAAEADPQSPMAYWGAALVRGPHINNPLVPPEREQAAHEAVQRALALRERANPTERALIEALQHRYTDPPSADRAPLNQAYADAMAAVWAAHPDDADVGALYAESLMDLQPWDLWTETGAPKGRTTEILTILEAVQRIQPDHPGALHFYIHAVEAGPDPGRALAAADRLRRLMPASGHMLHMPSHIDVLLGRWQEAIESNERAIESDTAYRAVRPEQDFHHVYMAHNRQMLAFAAMMDGRKAMVLESARQIPPGVPESYARTSTAFIEPYLLIPYDVLVRFGLWDEILAEPQPPDYLQLKTAMWHFARGCAFAAKGQVAEADLEAARLREATAAVPADRYMAINPAERVLSIAGHVLAGEIAYRKGDLDTAIAELQQAVAIEDRLLYMEPPEWTQPVRHSLGAILLEAGRVAEAEQAYRDDLAQWPDNGWSLYGLTQCIERRGGSPEELAQAQRLYRDAWADGDIQIGASCLCVAKASAR